MTGKFRNWAVLLCSILTASCSRTEPFDIEKEADRIRSEVCAKMTLVDAKRALSLLKLDYFVSNDGRQLTAINRYEEDQLVSSAIALTVNFNSDESVTKCTVEILHTGP